MTTEIEFIHLLRRQFLTPFCRFLLCAAPSQKMCARVTRDGAICAKNSIWLFRWNQPRYGEDVQFFTITERILAR